MEKNTSANLRPFKKGDAARPIGGRPKGVRNKPVTKADLKSQLVAFATRIDNSLFEIKDQLKAINITQSSRT
jgi:hypothetical protein